MTSIGNVRVLGRNFYGIVTASDVPSNSLRRHDVRWIWNDSVRLALRRIDLHGCTAYFAYRAFGSIFVGHRDGFATTIAMLQIDWLGDDYLARQAKEAH
jgi:hypothetical protein